MQAVKGIYKQGKIELLEPIGDIESADLFIVVIPHTNLENKSESEHEVLKKIKVESEEDFKQIGLNYFFNTEDDADVDWEDAFGL